MRFNEKCLVYNKKKQNILLDRVFLKIYLLPTHQIILFYSQKPICSSISHTHTWYTEFNIYTYFFIFYRKLFVGGLSWETTESEWPFWFVQFKLAIVNKFILSGFTEELREHFGQYGDIESINVKTDPQTGRSRGFAFIVYAAADSIDKVTAVAEHIINNKKVDPKKAKARHGKIFVGGLTTEISDDEIKTFFGQFGNVMQNFLFFFNSSLPIFSNVSISSNLFSLVIHPSNRSLKLKCHLTNKRTNAKDSVSSHSIRNKLSTNYWKPQNKSFPAKKSMWRRQHRNRTMYQSVLVVHVEIHVDVNSAVSVN